ncbi:MAG: shikimate kinase [Acidimicrobiia bacterium]
MWLVGMMGSGKTSAGRVAANRLGVQFADSDEEVERAAGEPMAHIWRSLGEQAFRRLESELMASLEGFEGIVASGGGAVLDEGNRDVMAAGTVVWLRASPQALAIRTARLGRPLLDEGDSLQTLSRLLRSREALYREVSHHEVDTEELEIDEVAERIETLWNG